MITIRKSSERGHIQQDFLDGSINHIPKRFCLDGRELVGAIAKKI